MRCVALISAALAVALVACSPGDERESAETADPPAEGAAAPEKQADASDPAAEADEAAEEREEASRAAAAPDDEELAQKQALADRLMEAMGVDVMVESLPDIFSEGAARSILSCTPATPEADVAEIERLMNEELTKAAPRYYERIRDSYVRRLTLEELQALADFYESPEGRGVAEAAADLVYDQYLAQNEIDRASTRAYERMGWCANAL